MPITRARIVVFCTCFLVTAALLVAAPTTLPSPAAATNSSDHQTILANGPTIPPGPWDDKPWPADDEVLIL